MKRLYVFLVLLCCTANLAFAQWNKLPKQIYYPDYGPFPSGGGSNFVFRFPDILFPVGDGHIFISAYENNGSVSANQQSTWLYETHDDFLTHHPIANKIDFLFSLYAKNDSCFIWFNSPTGNPAFAGYYSRAYQHTASDFLHIDSLSYCSPFGPPYTYTSPSTALTDRFVYSLFQGGSGFDDTLRFETYSLPGHGLISCTKLYKYMQGDVKFVNDSIGYINSAYKSQPAKKVLLKTSNYGQSWSEMYVDSVNTLTDFSCPAGDTLYILLSTGNLIKSANGGAAWSALPPNTSPAKCFSFYTGYEGYVGGGKGFLNKTTDGGQTWTNQASGSVQPIVSIYTFANHVTYFKDSISDLYKNTAFKLFVKNYSRADEVNVYPNPANDGFFTIDNLKKGSTIIQVYDVLGENVRTELSHTDKTRIDLSSQPKGIYFYRVISENKVIGSGKLMVD